ncbi:V-type ATP synthase subunit D [Eubacteriales bacterium OttesenSCG-928-G02]|nr:V-type ATP synthase subunit D [Eubacteriales bacterium OttesenSCG-928-G02]
MGAIPSKKILILNILGVLKKYSDENHRLSIKQIGELLEKEYSQKADRKTIKSNLTKSVMNIDVPDIRQKESGVSGITYGLAFSSYMLDDAVLMMSELMPKLYELAAVEKTCDLLADEMERTRRRVNALENVMIPEMESTIKYITLKLADNERGTLARLMKIKDMMVENI